MTNLFDAPAPVEVEGRSLEKNLIHRTRKGIAVRSKSEVVIADLLYSKGLEFTYEQPFHGADNRWKSPDFTIRDDDTGVTYLWEHLGMLDRPSYRQKWETKLEWYRANGVVEHAKGQAGPVVLVTSEDGRTGRLTHRSWMRWWSSCCSPCLGAPLCEREEGGQWRRYGTSSKWELGSRTHLVPTCTRSLPSSAEAVSGRCTGLSCSAAQGDDVRGAAARSASR